MTERDPELPPASAPPDEPGEGGIDETLVQAGEDGPRDGDVGQWEQDPEPTEEQEP